MRRAREIDRVPCWVDQGAIRDFYEAVPPGMVVDHVLPLKGKRVSGLHVRDNLQYLSAAENSAKNNKYEIPAN